MNHRLPLLAVLAVTIPGCALMMSGVSSPEQPVVDNPLTSGQPLETVKKSDVGTVREPDCKTWPFEDTISVAVTEAQICISNKKHVVASPGWSGEPTSNRSEFFRVVNDANEGGTITVEKARASKVSSCFNRGYNSEVKIWALEYKGCAPNNGTITEATKSLRVGNDGWTFTGAAGDGAAGSATMPAGDQPSS
jgi:hypothetical protein